jgi:hypothetical protein
MPMDFDCITKLLGIPGVRVVAIEQRRDGMRSQVLLRLERMELKRFRCSGVMSSFEV